MGVRPSRWEAVLPVSLTLRLSLVLVLVMVMVMGCGDRAVPETPKPAPGSLRHLGQGDVVGYEGRFGNHAWRGIPYAKPPTGSKRWSAPHAPEAWTGVRQALTQSASCPQFASPGGGPNGEPAGAPTGNEDCLYANVFAPPFAAGKIPTGNERLPVMLWIHGGGNTVGDSGVYDGGRLAASHQLILVTVNYRLGVFGWFTHPALRSGVADPLDRSGNWGTLDLIQALRWTQENAAAFGGDPSRITIFGESAGGTNVMSLLVSPAARGKFQGAISQSGGLRTTPLEEAENLTDASMPGDEWSSSEVLLRLFIADGAVDRSAAKIRLASMDAAEISSYLRARNSTELLSVFEGKQLGGMYRIPTLVRDGLVVPGGEPEELFASAGGTRAVPTILGSNRDETKLFMLFGSNHVRRVFGLPLWLADEAAYDLLAEYQSGFWKASGVDEPTAAMRSAREAPVYAYRFDWDEEPQVLLADFSKLLGAAHALEIPFVFGTFDLGIGNRFLWDEDRVGERDALSNEMMSYWANFAYTGDPGRGRSGTLERWTMWDESSDSAPKFMVLDTRDGGGSRMSSESVTTDALLARLEDDDRFVSERDRCEIYFQLATWQDAISEAEYAAAAGGVCREYPLDGYPWSE